MKVLVIEDEHKIANSLKKGLEQESNLVSDKTVINKASLATKADLKTGEKVAVIGQENTDGTVYAQNIQLNPTP